MPNDGLAWLSAGPAPAADARQWENYARAFLCGCDARRNGKRGSSNDPRRSRRGVYDQGQRIPFCTLHVGHRGRLDARCAAARPLPRNIRTSWPLATPEPLPKENDMTTDSNSVPCIRKSKPLSRRLLCGASLAAVLACAPAAAHAEDRYWDANGTTIGSGGTGSWNLANLNWSPNGDGVSGPFVEPWVNGDLDDAIFGGTAGTVTVGVPVTVGNITFSSAGYVLNGSTITLGGANSTITTLSGNSRVDSDRRGVERLDQGGQWRVDPERRQQFRGRYQYQCG